MGKIFIGYLFVFFHIKLNGFDILADCVGFFLIWQGLCAHDVPRFWQAKPWALGLGLVSLLSIFGGFSLTFGRMLLLVNLATTLASLYLLWLIVQGMGELEAVHNLPLGADELKRLWKVQAGASINALLLSYIPANIAAILSAVVLLVALAANVLFLVHIYKAKKTLDEAEML